MYCPNCGSENDDTYQYCLKCGKPLIRPGTNPIEKVADTRIEAIPDQPAHLKSAGGRTKDLLSDKITPAEGEVSVRTYYCTYYISRLLGLEAWGYLGVTNKRVIFQALGTSNAGSSVIQSELPIADVSGISSYKGTFFSFGHMGMALAMSSIIALIFSSIIGPLATGIGLALAAASESGGWSGVGLEVTGWILGIVGLLGSIAIVRSSIWRPILAAVSAASFSIAAGGSMLSSLTGSWLSGGQDYLGRGSLAVFALAIGFCVLIYFLFCVVWYARRPTFSLAISSKGGSNTPISISGASGLGLFSVSAGKALTAEPAPDAEPMLQQLGAVILDVQMLGDMGITKWQAL